MTLLNKKKGVLNKKNSFFFFVGELNVNVDCEEVTPLNNKKGVTKNVLGALLNNNVFFFFFFFFFL